MDLKGLRTALGLTQAELANKAKVCEKTVRVAEDRGELPRQNRTRRALARALKIQIPAAGAA